MSEKGYCEALAEKWSQHQGALRSMKVWTMDRCFYCGIPMDGIASKRTRDHLYPKWRGGVHTVSCCLQCNSEKGGMSLSRFRKHVLGGTDIKRFFGEFAMGVIPHHHAASDDPSDRLTDIRARIAKYTYGA